MNAMIRKAMVSDSSEISRVVNSNLDDYFAPEVIDFFLMQWPDGQFLATDYCGNPIGVLMSAKLSGGRATISLLAVEADVRSRGIGSTLINRFRQECLMNGISMIQLEVRTTNKNAISFYQGHGFSVTETLDGYYNNGGSAYRMTSSVFNKTDQAFRSHILKLNTC